MACLAQFGVSRRRLGYVPAPPSPDQRNAGHGRKTQRSRLPAAAGRSHSPRHSACPRHVCGEHHGAAAHRPCRGAAVYHRPGPDCPACGRCGDADPDGRHRARRLAPAHRPGHQLRLCRHPHCGDQGRRQPRRRLRRQPCGRPVPDNSWLFHPADPEVHSGPGLRRGGDDDRLHPAAGRHQIFRRLRRLPGRLLQEGRIRRHRQLGDGPVRHPHDSADPPVRQGSVGRPLRSSSAS